MFQLGVNLSIIKQNIVGVYLLKCTIKKRDVPHVNLYDFHLHLIGLIIVETRWFMFSTWLGSQYNKDKYTYSNKAKVGEAAYDFR